MVKNAKLWELARKIEAFVGFIDDTLGDPSFVDMSTQIIDLRLNAEKVWGRLVHIDRILINTSLKS